MHFSEVKEILDSIYREDLPTQFITEDPIQIPHRFSKKQDIEITAFWTAILAWGLRKTIINKATELFALMDNAPYEFIMQHSDNDLKRFESFKHRTFQFTDTLYFLHFFRNFYQKNTSLEEAFLINNRFEARTSLMHFYELFFNSELAPQRTRKHISTPAKKSACKRINLFLKWMVRSDNKSGDLGIFNNIQPDQLMLPLDVHVLRSVQKLGITKSQKSDWKTVEETTEYLRQISPTDPIKYDYSLFLLSKNG